MVTTFTLYTNATKMLLLFLLRYVKICYAYIHSSTLSRVNVRLCSRTVSLLSSSSPSFNNCNKS